MIGSIVLSLLLAAAPADGLAERMAVPPATGPELSGSIRTAGGASEAHSDPRRTPRRQVRKRQLLRPIMMLSHRECADRSVPLLADELDLQLRTRRRAQDATTSVELVRLRLSAAGAAASHLHLPPPHPSL